MVAVTSTSAVQKDISVTRKSKPITATTGHFGLICTLFETLLCTWVHAVICPALKLWIHVHLRNFLF